MVEAYLPDWLLLYNKLLVNIIKFHQFSKFQVASSILTYFANQHLRMSIVFTPHLLYIGSMAMEAIFYMALSHLC